MIVLKTGKSERSPMRKLHAIDSMLDFKLLAKLFNQIEQNHSSKRWVMFSSCVPKNFRSKSTSTSHSEQNLHFLNSKKKKNRVWKISETATQKNKAWKSFRMSNSVYEVILRNQFREFRALYILVFAFRLKKDLTVQNSTVDEFELIFR